MRYVVFGAGAIGCTLGAHLHMTGAEVVLVGRGEQARVIGEAGLHFVTGDHDLTLDIPIVDSATSAGSFTDETTVLLCVKSQHTLPALGQLKSAGAGRSTSLVCCQNGIWNEPTAARVFRDIHGMSTLVRSVFLRPGLVLNPMTGTYGFVEVGRFPSGVDSLDEALADDLRRAGFSARTHPDVMLPKAAKCLGNLGNVVRALVDPVAEELEERLRTEAADVWRACGIEWEDYAEFRRRVEELRGRFEVPPGYEDELGFGSTWQSIRRNAGSVETGLLNGEVVRLGELVGVEAPYNRLVTDLAEQMVREGLPLSWYTEQEILDMVPGSS